MGIRNLSDPKAYVDIHSVLNALWTRKHTADAHAAMVSRGRRKGYHDLAYYLGEANALAEMIDWVEDYEE